MWVANWMPTAGRIRVTQSGEGISGERIFHHVDSLRDPATQRSGTMPDIPVEFCDLVEQGFVDHLKATT